MAFHVSNRIRRASYLSLLSFAILVMALTVLYYPQSVDVVSSSDPATMRKDYRAFYEDAYAPADKMIDPKIESSYNPRNVPANVPAQIDPQTVDMKEFVQRYSLQN